jgi:hypothetical protein
LCWRSSRCSSALTSPCGRLLEPGFSGLTIGPMWAIDDGAAPPVSRRPDDAGSALAAIISPVAGVAHRRHGNWTCLSWVDGDADRNRLCAVMRPEEQFEPRGR